MKQVHIAIEDVAAKWRIREHVIGRGIAQVPEIICGRDCIADVYPFLLRKKRLRMEELIVRSVHRVHLPTEELEDIPFVVDRSDIVRLVLSI